jgi:hypothetical protein
MWLQFSDAGQHRRLMSHGRKTGFFQSGRHAPFLGKISVISSPKETLLVLHHALRGHFSQEIPPAPW